jgi:hypothetical protein
MIPKANEILAPFGMVITSPVSIPDMVIDYKDAVGPASGFDILRVRKAAEKQRPGFPNVLRIIACPFEAAAGTFFGLTDGGIGASSPELQAFQDFILINVMLMRQDNMTLLHEMIHAATGLDINDHDDPNTRSRSPDPRSIFSTSSQRCVLKPEHAEGLSKGFFATPN